MSHLIPPTTLICSINTPFLWLWKLSQREFKQPVQGHAGGVRTRLCLSPEPVCYTNKVSFLWCLSLRNWPSVPKVQSWLLHGLRLSSLSPLSSQWTCGATCQISATAPASHNHLKTNDLYRYRSVSVGLTFFLLSKPQCPLPTARFPLMLFKPLCANGRVTFSMRTSLTLPR